MRWKPGPSGLLRLAAAITLGLSFLLSSHAVPTPDTPRTTSFRR